MLQILQATVWRSIRSKLRMKAYGIQLVQEDNVKRFCYDTTMLEVMEEDNFDARLIFSEEATFHINDKGNRHNIRILGTEMTTIVCEHQRDTPKVNVFCAMLREKCTVRFCP